MLKRIKICILKNQDYLHGFLVQFCKSEGAVGSILTLGWAHQIFLKTSFTGKSSETILLHTSSSIPVSSSSRATSSQSDGKEEERKRGRSGEKGR